MLFSITILVSILMITAHLFNQVSCLPLNKYAAIYTNIPTVPTKTSHLDVEPLPSLIKKLRRDAADVDSASYENDYIGTTYHELNKKRPIYQLDPALKVEYHQDKFDPTQTHLTLFKWHRKDAADSGEILEPASSRYYYRPIFRVRNLRSRRRRLYDGDEDWENAGYLRPGKDVGYMDSYDDFPTVA